MNINIENLNKYYGDYRALIDVDLNIKNGELISLLGPSGSGKTTLLRTIAGLETYDRGSITFGDDANGNPGKQGIGFVFQHYALFRHMKVYDNIAFGLTCKPRKERPSKEQIKEKVSELLSLVQLDNLADRYPSELSGGQRQRVALARALAVEPRVLLLDEPFGALDAKVRKDLRKWLRRLHDDLHITSVFVTHDQEEALEVADRIVVMNKGRIEQTGSPDAVYEKPANAFVYSFLGNVNLFHTRLVNGNIIFSDKLDERPSDLRDAQVMVRPHDVEIMPDGGQDGLGAVVVYIRRKGPVVSVELQGDGNSGFIDAEVSLDVFDKLNVEIGQKVRVRFKNQKVYARGEEFDYVI